MLKKNCAIFQLDRKICALTKILTDVTLNFLSISQQKLFIFNHRIRPMDYFFQFRFNVDVDKPDRSSFSLRN